MASLKRERPRILGSCTTCRRVRKFRPMTAFIRTYAEPGADLQSPFDVAVVIPTILRSEIREALHSIFQQSIQGRIHAMIGIDVFSNDISILDAACESRPPNCVVQVFYPGYSTSSHHGGLSPSGTGGVLRGVLSYLANSPFVAYLDDDNWWHPDHLRLLREAITRADWAFSRRWFVHPLSRRPVCIDEWESVGPGKGIFAEKYGGFVDPSCLMLSKPKCDIVFSQWNKPLPTDPTGMTADRVVFDALHRFFRGADTGLATAFYTLDPNDDGHSVRLRLIGSAYERAAAVQSAIV
jgi:glycosyltransferase involved in cell wall biosynthesis